jgi:hypothetical protein
MLSAAPPWPLFYYFSLPNFIVCSSEVADASDVISLIISPELQFESPY